MHGSRVPHTAYWPLPAWPALTTRLCGRQTWGKYGPVTPVMLLLTTISSRSNTVWCLILQTRKSQAETYNVQINQHTFRTRKQTVSLLYFAHCSCHRTHWRVEFWTFTERVYSERNLLLEPHWVYTNNQWLHTASTACWPSLSLTFTDNFNIQLWESGFLFFYRIP